MSAQPGNTLKLLKPAEVCERLSVSPETMHRLIKRGELKAVKLGPRSTRIYADSVENLLKNGASDA